MAVEEYGAAIVNDISGGALDPEMYRTVAALQVPYILMHMKGDPQTMQSLTDYSDVTLEVIDYFAERIGKLRPLGCTPAEALGGTTFLHALALERGAQILRVHDVRAAAEAITLYEQARPYLHREEHLHYSFSRSH